MKFAVLSDTHFIDDRSAKVGDRCAGFADILVRRAVHRLNRYIKPDLVVVLGDVLNDGNSPQALDHLARMKSVFDLLKCPALYIPGNHDGSPEAFYTVFPRPPATMDVGGVRFVCFVDSEEPGYNARRAPDAAARLQAARADWRGALVSLQHVPVFPPGAHACPYNYVDAAEVVGSMSSAGVTLSVSGHWHQGSELLQTGGTAFLVAPALCEAPFPYLIVDMDNDRIQVRREQLAMPSELGLTDSHVHTQLAYCSENMDAGLTLELARTFGLRGLRFAEHSGHLYFSLPDYHRCGITGIDGINPTDNRIETYFDLLRQVGCPRDWVGIEIDACDDGSPLIRPADAARTAFRIGAVHQLAEQRTPQPDAARIADDFLAATAVLVRSDIDVLAHPFRIFRRLNLPVPAKAVDAVVRMLAESGVTAEINFHTNNPDPQFARACIDAGVKLAFGGDAHNLYEIGEFYPHLQLLRAAGYDGDPAAVLLPLT